MLLVYNNIIMPKHSVAGVEATHVWWYQKQYTTI